MDNLNKPFIYFILSYRGQCGITEIVKLCYLIDLLFKQETWKKLSTFEYIRYHYWPFTIQIDGCLNELLNEWLIKKELIPQASSDYFAKFSVLPNITFSGFLTEDQKSLCSQMLDDLTPYNALQLTKIAYETEPMKRLGATLWGNEHLGESLGV